MKDPIFANIKVETDGRVTDSLTLCIKDHPTQRASGIVLKLRATVQGIRFLQCEACGTMYLLNERRIRG